MQDVANESTDNSLGFPLHQAIVKGLTKKLNVTSFFPIQKRVFSIITETSYSSGSSSYLPLTDISRVHPWWLQAWSARESSNGLGENACLRHPHRSVARP